MTHAKTYPSSDCGLDCDHVPVVAVMKVKLKKVNKRKTCKVRNEWKDLNGEQLRRKYLVDVKNTYEVLGEDVSEDEEEGVEREWRILQKTLVETAENVLPEKARTTRQPWMTQDILSLMDERRRWKLNTAKYRELDKEIKKKCRERREERILQKWDEIDDLEKTRYVLL